MRFLPNIRYGTERYPEKVARRLRALNFATWLAAATHAVYALFLLFIPALHWLALVNAAGLLLYAGSPLLHRLSPLAAPIAVILLLDLDMALYVYLLGTGLGIQFYILIGVALTVLYLGTEHLILVGVLGAVSAALIVVLHVTVPYETGLLPPTVYYFSIITNAFASSAVLLLIVGYALRQAARAENAAEYEHERSERLLANILPPAIADRLKGESNAVIADRYDEASVLFADMAGFTAQASEIAPDDLVQFLNRVFSDLDRLVERHGLEKIKTTGDAYMVVSGVPEPRPDHAAELADLALDMRDALAGLTDPKGRAVPVRIGMASGPVVAGVVGTRKFFYDVWGDAVNTASRMESTGEPGEIQVAPATRKLLADRFELAERGTIEVRGKGPMQTWFLTGRKPQAATPVGKPQVR